MNSGLPDNVLLFGKVLRPHGLAGLLRIRSFSDSAASLLNAKTVLLKPESGEYHRFTINSVRPHKSVFLIELKELRDATSADAYRGADVYISKTALVREADEYFWFELLGLEVFLENGDFLGVVSKIMPAGRNEIYVVKNGDREILLPAAREVIRRIDLKTGKMTVSAMEGLLDLNEV